MTDDVDKVFDPFLGREVEISARLTDRLRGRYASGPTLPNGEPEFGWREFGPPPPIQLEAAAEIEKLRAELAEYERLFDLRWAADMRAVRMWRKEAPGRDLTFPDRTDLVLYLLQKLDEKP